MKEVYFVDLEKGVRALLQLSRLNGYHEVANLFVPVAHRGKGHGRTLLKRCVDDADSEGVVLTLLVATGGGLTDDQLAQWYRRYGFAPMLPGSLSMLRNPK